jgi:topoisomerase-4 subunit A
MMESLFRLTELESRIPLNLNVLVKGRSPQGAGLAECLREWLDHLRDVLVAAPTTARARSSIGWKCSAAI